MAKASKASKASAKPVSQLALDTATIAKDFARTANHNIDPNAVAALLRQVTNVDGFKAIKVEALAHWAVARAAHYLATDTKAIPGAKLDWTAKRRELDLKTARSIFDGSTRGMTTMIGNKPQRDVFMQHLNVTGVNEWSRYLATNSIETLTEGKGGARGPRNKPEEAPAEAPAQANPIAFEAIQVEHSADFAGVLAQANKSSAHLSRVCKENAKLLIKGDAGQRLNALQAYVAKELKAIAALTA